jgi:Fic family protein
MDEYGDLPVEPYAPFPSFRGWSERLTFDPELVHNYAGLLNQTRQGVSNENMVRAVQSATKWASVDTGALEGLYEVDRGFTYSVAAGAAAWDRMHLIVGEEVARVINDAMAGYELVLDVATKSRPITETLIKELHATICANQPTYTVMTAVGPQQHALPLAQYKQNPNNPYNLNRGSVHSYAPVDEVSSEMHRLIEQLESAEFVAAEPVIQSAYAHYAFVCVHPFADGNGRVARALASIFTYREPGVPLVIFADQKAAYLDSLESADDGDYAPIVQFFSERLIDTISLVRTEMTRRHAKTLEERRDEYSRTLMGRGGLTHVEYDTLALHLATEFVHALNTGISTDMMPPGMAYSVQSVNPDVRQMPDGYRQPPSMIGAALSGSSQPPASATYGRVFSVVIARPETSPPEFLIIDTSSGAILFEAFLREMHPVIQQTVHYRLRVLVEEQAGDMVESLIADAENSLRNAGYL